MMALAVLAADNQDKDKVAQEKWRRFREGPHVKRGVLPDIKLRRSMAARVEEAEQIKNHIANLAKIDKPDFGLSGTMGGTAFAPIAGSEKTTVLLLTNHQLQTNEDFRKLVALGPKALPFLLDALEDKTPTKLKQTHGGGFGGMFLCAEMGLNPTNSIEQKAVANLPKRDLGFSDGNAINAYTIKVGDVCFVAIGQIVGRTYQAVRYQPTAIVIINSPTENPKLAKAVRDIWSSPNAAQKLFDSLLFDYSTEGVAHGESLDGWHIGSQLQCEAARRMLYYFPQETSGLIAARLRRLNVSKQPEDMKLWMQVEVANGVSAEDFIKAVAWSGEPVIKQELLDIFKRTAEPPLLLAALAGLDTAGNPLVRQRLIEMINQQPVEEDGAFGGGYDLLIALGKNPELEAIKATYVRYLKKANLQRWRTMIHVLRETRKDLAVELLAPALNDKREFGWSYALVKGQNEPRRPIRICDEAAETISMSRPEMPFKMEGEHKDLDRQISVMRELIEKSAR
jgi:hypothetical protein